MAVTSASAAELPVGFTIAPISPVYDRGEPVELRLALTNHSDGPMTVNARFLVNYHVYSEHEVVFYITRPDGTEARFLPVVFAGSPERRFFETLTAGGSAERTVDLRTWFDLSTPGTYRVFAGYWNRYEPGWQGQVYSAATSFEVR